MYPATKMPSVRMLKGCINKVGEQEHAVKTFETECLTAQIQLAEPLSMCDEKEYSTTDKQAPGSETSILQLYAPLAAGPISPQCSVRPTWLGTK